MKNAFRARQQLGFTLIEVLLALGIMISIGGLAMSQLRRGDETAQARAAGEQLKLVGLALNQYIALQYTNITNMVTVTGSGSVADPGPRTCNSPSAGFCTVTSDTLRLNGLLPSNFSGRNAYGAQYLYYIRRQGAGPNWQVDGMVVTDTAYNNGGATPRYDLLGTAMQEAGADSGMTRSVATRIEGYNGAWLDSGFPVNTLGLLAYRGGYASSGFSAYLRLDGSTPMTGDLNMNAHNITGAATLESTTGLVVDNEGTSNLILGNTAGGTTFGAATGSLAIRNTGGVALVSPASNAVFEPLRAGATTVDNLSALTVSTTANGNITANGSGNISTTSGGIFTGSGNITTTSGSISAGGAASNIIAGGSVVSKSAAGGVFSEGNLYAGYDGTTSAASSYVSTTGSGGWYNATYGGGWVMTDANWVRTYSTIPVLITGNLTVQGTTTSTGRLTANEYIQLQGTGTSGTACPAGSPSAGLLGIQADGTLLACKAGTWAKTNGFSSVTQASGASACGATKSQATCPAGYSLMGGGYALISQAQAYSNEAPQQSYPNIAAGAIPANTWVVTSGDAGSCFQATAICGL
jgi:type II secretory pathway pseudopilin PulG